MDAIFAELFDVSFEANSFEFGVCSPRIVNQIPPDAVLSERFSSAGDRPADFLPLNLIRVRLIALN